MHCEIIQMNDCMTFGRVQIAVDSSLLYLGGLWRMSICGSDSLSWCCNSGVCVPSFDPANKSVGGNVLSTCILPSNSLFTLNTCLFVRFATKKGNHRLSPSHPPLCTLFLSIVYPSDPYLILPPHIQAEAAHPETTISPYLIHHPLYPAMTSSQRYEAVRLP